MLRRGVVAVALLVAAVVVAGCHGGQAAKQVAWARSSGQGHAVHMFGPTALPVGGEDLGYFARVEPEEEPLMIWDYRANFVRHRIWEVEDNRRPDRSYHRRRTWAEEIRASHR